MNGIFKVAMLALLVAVLPVITAFRAEEKDYKDFYIYMFAHEHGNYDNVYVSDMIHYQIEPCGASYHWRPKVEKAFKDYLKGEHNFNYEYIYLIGSTTGNYLDTQQKAIDAFNVWQAKHKEEGHTVTKTLFKHSCN